MADPEGTQGTEDAEHNAAIKPGSQEPIVRIQKQKAKKIISLYPDPWLLLFYRNPTLNLYP